MKTHSFPTHYTVGKAYFFPYMYISPTHIAFSFFSVSLSWHLHILLGELLAFFILSTLLKYLTHCSLFLSIFCSSISQFQFSDCELSTFDAINKRCRASAKKIMQLYHHPYSLDSQKVRLALEEKGIDYTSNHASPLTGKNLDSSFFRMNTTAKLPVFQNGGHIMYDTIEIIKYIERVTIVSSGIESNTINVQEVNEWMQKIQKWNPKIFTLSHVPEKHRLFVSKFIRRVVVARMAEYPDLASTYHLKLKDAYETEEKLKDPGVLKQIEEELDQLLDEVEIQLSETTYLAGEEFTMADVMLIPVLARIELLDLQDKYIGSRPKIVEYLEMVKQRPSYKVVIGKYFSGWRKYRTLFKTWCFVCLRSVLRKY